MRTNTRILTVVSVFITVSILWAIVLFCVDFASNCFVLELASPYNRLQLTPQDVLTDEQKSDPNIRDPFWHANYYTEMIGLTNLGFLNWLMSDNINYINLFDDFDNLERSQNKYSYYDKKLGTFVYCELVKVKKRWEENIICYAGPKGISEDFTESIGRFQDPLLDNRFNFWDGYIYDRQLRQFFSIRYRPEIIAMTSGGDLVFNIDAATVKAGPKLAANDSRNPVQLGKGSLYKGLDVVDVYWSNPQQKVTKEKDGEKVEKWETIPVASMWSQNMGLLVLDESGVIQFLNKETLEYGNKIGYLPKHRSGDPAKPDELTAFAVTPLSLRTDKGGDYLGLCAATTRDGLDLKAYVFDEKGYVKSNSKDIKEPRRYSMRGYVERGWHDFEATIILKEGGGPLVVTVKYAIETLQSPVFNLASFGMANTFEAGSSFRALFIRPNSFNGRLGQTTNMRNIFGNSIGAFLLTLPAILLSVLLAIIAYWRAKVLGYSSRARLLWFWSIVALGIPAFVTFKLTLPKEVMVTCVNCGKLRRPSDANCHWCKVDWDANDRQIPMWRIYDPVEDVPNEPEAA